MNNNTFKYLPLKVLHKLYTKTFGGYHLLALQREEDPDKASEMIYNLLMADKPCMIARFGSTELSALVNCLGVNSKHHSILKYIKGEQPEWWWNQKIMNQMQQWSGFFPPTPENMQRFGDLMMEDMKELNLLGCWVKNEAWFAKDLKNAQRVHLRLLEPFWANKPWTYCLKDKNVVVVHPFTEDILSQYTNNRTLLFSNPDMLPEFASLRTVKAVQSLGGEDNGFKDWFEALKWMEDEIDKKDYDVCLIGCGAYGFPLAAHVKRQGKKGVHLGGALQLLFGIRGKRWENPSYGVKEWGIPYGSYLSLMNKYWVRPRENGRPKNANQVEGGCYW